MNWPTSLLAEWGRVRGAGRVAERAFDLRAETRGSALRGLRPVAALPGRPVPDVLRMSAGELRDPVALLVLMESRDCGQCHRIEDHGNHFSRAGRAPTERPLLERHRVRLLPL